MLKFRAAFLLMLEVTEFFKTFYSFFFKPFILKVFFSARPRNKWHFYPFWVVSGY